MTGHPESPGDEGRVVAPGAVAFEREDVDPGVVAKWAIGLGSVSILSAAVAVWLFVFLRKHEATGDPQRPSLYFSSETRQPEGVRLQTTPFTDLRAMREQERQILSTYGWVDEAAGVVHIPITEAMRLYALRQVREAPGGSSSGDASPPGAATPADQRIPTDSAPVPFPAAPPAQATPLSSPAASPVASGTSAPPAAHTAVPTGAHR